ncbi:MAG: ABC transporter permease subunit, partial [Clostridia bacterium]
GNIWALILPYCMNTWNMMVMRSSFRAIPESIEESTRIDGASEWTILIRIALPLCLPVVAVMVLFYSLSYWNSWFAASLFIHKRALYP